MRIGIFVILLIVTFSCNKGSDLELNLSSITNKPESRSQAKPQCQSICSEDSRVLKGNDHAWNFLAFKNFGHRGVGRCRGHAIVSQKMSELANFDGVLDCKPNSLSIACKKDISHGINQVMNFQVYQFSGFKNLYEFSSHPYVAEILKFFIKTTNHRYSAVNSYREDLNYDSEDDITFFEIIRRVKDNQLPYIGIKGQTIGNHAVLGYQLDFKNSKDIICVRDSNIIAESIGEHCENFIYRENGNIYYQRENQIPTILYTFSLTSDEDARVSLYISSRHRFCIEDNLRKNQCKN